MTKNNMRRSSYAILALFVGLSISFYSCDKDQNTTPNTTPDISGYPIVGTGQTTFFDTSDVTSVQSVGDAFYGQNANYEGNTPQYVDNGDGTVTDKVSGLMWQQTFDHNGDGSIDVNDKLSYDDLLAAIDTVSTAGYTDWRLPSIKEMYSLILYSGRDVNPLSTSTDNQNPFIDNTTFGFAYGDLNAGERIIDVQCATTNVYVSSEVEKMVFGVNFADGRIKGYGMTMMGQPKMFNYLLVRGNSTYGQNNFVDNGDGTISDKATGLMWMQDDSKQGMNWAEALKYAENFEFAGYSDWRLPDAKELQSLVDYTRSPATTNSAAIDPLFNCTQITNEAGNPDFPWYWSSTTHAVSSSGGSTPVGGWAVYVAFGRSLGYMSPDPQSQKSWVDVHGAGSQRSDPKTGDASQYSEGHGPQGDAVRIYNYVRLVRNI